MALNDKTTKPATAAQTPTRAPVDTGTPVQSVAADVATRAVGSIFALAGTGNTPVRPVADAETLRRLHEGLSSFLKEAGAGWHAMPLDAAANRLPANALAVCKFRADKKLFVSVIMTQAPTGRIQPRVEQYMGQQYELPVTTGDCWNNDFWAAVERRLKDSIANVAEVIDSGCLVVPSDIDTSDETAMRRLAHVLFANITAKADEAMPLNLAIALRTPEEPAQLNGTVQFPLVQTSDAVGRPVRADFVISVGASPANTKPGTIANAGCDLFRVHGYVDTNFVGPVGQQVVNGIVQPGSTKAYMAEAVITDISTLSVDMHLDRVLMALVSAGLLEENALWSWAYQPRGMGGKGSKNDINQRDVGILGTEYQPQPGAPFAPVKGLKGGAMSPEEMGAFFNDYFHRNLIISLQVDPTGPYSAIYNEFISSAMGNQAATTAILNAANNLTGGAFSNHWKQGSQVVTLRRQILLGTYTDANGEKRDIRDIDHLAILALTQQDPHTRASYIETIENRAGRPASVCLAERARLLGALLPGYELVGYGYHLTFTPDFLSALAAAMKEVGAGIRLNDSRGSFYGVPQVRQNLGLLGLGNSGIGQQLHQTQQFGTQTNVGYAGSSRW